jgi:hypothetical protein
MTEFLTSNRTYWVRTDGNDSNNGLSDSAAGAFATWQKAADVISGDLFIPPLVTVTVRAGGTGVRTWTGTSGVHMCSITGWPGGGNVLFLGDATTPSNVQLTANTAAVFRVRGVIGDGLTIRGFQLASSTASGQSIRHGAIGYVHMDGNYYGEQSMVQVEASDSYLDHTGAQAIVGNPNIDKFIDCDFGYIYMGTGTFTIAGNPVWGTCCMMCRNGGRMFSNAETWVVTGNPTGRRFVVRNGSWIGTQDTNLDRYPGSTAGTCEAGGVYDIVFPGIVREASQAQMEAGSVTDYAVTPGRQQYHPSAAKGWVRAANDGTIQGSYNVSSVADTGTGQLTVSWNVDFSSSAYACTVSTINGSRYSNLTSQAAGSIVLQAMDHNGNLADPSAYCASAFGDQ